MSKRSWWIALLALVVGAGGIAAVARSLPATDAGRARPPASLAACAKRPATGPGAAAAPGSFFKLLPVLDAGGVLTGQRLVVGHGGLTTGTAVVAPESTATGPVAGVIVIADDDGRASTIRLVAAGAGCATVAHTTDSVVRQAILDPVDGSILFHTVDRASRADLGTWRLGPGGGAPTRIVEPLPAGLVAGPVWATDIRLDQAGRLLAVQSCVDRACVLRLVDLTAPGSPVLLRGPAQGPVLGFAGGRIVTWAACEGFPCGLLAWDPATGASSQLVGDAVAAGLTGDGSLLVAVVADAAADGAIAIDPSTGAVTPLRGLAAGERPIPVGGLATIGLEVGAGELAVVQPAGNPRAYHPTPAGEVAP